jgi:hypothetical protein
MRIKQRTYTPSSYKKADQDAAGKGGALGDAIGLSKPWSYGGIIWGTGCRRLSGEELSEFGKV